MTKTVCRGYDRSGDEPLQFNGMGFALKNIEPVIPPIP